jgi:cytochrome c oxidase subunit II
MAILPPQNRLWWNEPLDRVEILWIAIAFLWGVVMFATMIWWHIYGQQNLTNESYRVVPEEFGERTEAMVDRYTVREEGETGVPVVHPPPGTEVYMRASLWEWYPILELEKGQTYRVHLSSMDWQHGFSLQPTNINLQIHPKYDLVVTMTPNETGEFGVICNEYCGIGHHQMLGKIYVVE